ncbi:MAG: hypothetical protein FD135_5102, partial [Comamonadaceae bacterium]
PAVQPGVNNGGRIELNANAELLKNGDNFVTARGTLIVPVNGTAVAIDDAWLKFGNSSVDFKVGRHEAADLFPVGKDTVLDLSTAAGYRANALRGRVTDGRLHAVLGLNASSALRIELGLVTEDKNDSLLAAPTKAHGLRPTLVYSAGPLALRAGVESYKIGKTSYTGTGLSAGYAFAADSNVNANYARRTSNNAALADASSFGLNVVFGAAGLGYVKDKNHSVGATAAVDVSTVYAAYTIPLLGVKGATTPSEHGFDFPRLNFLRLTLQG